MACRPDFGGVACWISRGAYQKAWHTTFHEPIAARIATTQTYSTNYTGFVTTYTRNDNNKWIEKHPDHFVLELVANLEEYIDLIDRYITYLKAVAVDEPCEVGSRIVCDLLHAGCTLEDLNKLMSGKAHVHNEVCVNRTEVIEAYSSFFCEYLMGVEHDEWCILDNEEIISDYDKWKFPYDNLKYRIGVVTHPSAGLGYARSALRKGGPDLTKAFIKALMSQGNLAETADVYNNISELHPEPCTCMWKSYISACTMHMEDVPGVKLRTFIQVDNENNKAD